MNEKDRPVLRVNFQDNDFGWEFEAACNDYVKWHCGDEEYGPYAVKRYRKLLSEVGMEEIRRGFILCAWGHLIARHGIREHFIRYKFGGDEKPDVFAAIEDRQATLKYFDGQLTVEEVPAVGTEEENGEVCYVDIWKGTVTTR